ncbi:MAG TPA: cyclopropane-fatty-acyl-phospholipid synthase family protein [Jatrophihabitans sp.]|nr:cyclopropane-fatty-acyl-phospholipid synthase family protein [Jatrophihabitans sp.]
MTTAGRMTTAERLTVLLSGVLGGRPPVRIQAWDGSVAGPADAPTVQLRSRRVLRRLLWQPNELGVAQAYVAGELAVPGGADRLAEGLVALWQHARANRLGRVELSAAGRLRAAVIAARLGAFGPRPPAPAAQARPAGAVHGRDRDRAVIAHHYDLSNAFYRLILDPSMAYSCAYYVEPGMRLAQAQQAKLDLICRKLRLRPGTRLLDVGCGWGSLCLHAAERYGASVLGVTISRQQYEFVSRRIAERGLADRVTVRLQDYRDLPAEEFDAVSSIEMGEHVGQQNYPRYLKVLFDALRPGGRLLLQQMSRRADAAPGGGPFIEHYIAPDMHMRPVEQTAGELTAAGFRICDIHPMGEHYAQTVEDWLANFEAHYADVVGLVGEQVARVWRLYLVGGGLSFAEGRMGVEQLLAERPA